MKILGGQRVPGSCRDIDGGTGVSQADASKVSATTKALNIDEVLERIFAYLPLEKLLVARQVNKHWDAMYQIDRFQQALFIKPISDTLVYWHRFSNDPLKASHGAWSTSETELVPTKVFLNPMIKVNSGVVPSGRKELYHSQLEKWESLGNTRLHGTAWDMWKCRLMTQPPMAWIRLEVDGRPQPAMIATYNKEHMSVTLGQLCVEILRYRPGLMILGSAELLEVDCAADMDVLRPSHKLDH